MLCENTRNLVRRVGYKLLTRSSNLKMFRIFDVKEHFSHFACDESDFFLKTTKAVAYGWFRVVFMFHFFVVVNYHFQIVQLYMFQTSCNLRNENYQTRKSET